MKYCSKCGQENPDDAKFCSACGNELDNDIKLNKTNETSKKEKKKLSKGNKIFIVILVLIIATGSGYGVYYLYRNYKFNEAVSIGNNFLNENKYQEALSKYQEALNLKKDEPDIYLKEATAALHIRDNEIAKTAYSELYNLTQDERYKNLANLVDFGNTPNNLINGGNLAFQGEVTYFLDNRSGEADIWKVTPDRMELIKTIPYHQGNQPLKSLNVWGNQLFFILDDNINILDIERKDLNVIPISYVNNLCIYKGAIYYTTTYTPTDIAPGVYKCNLDGSNPETIFYGSNIFVNFNFIINNDFLYLNQTAFNASESHLVKISLQDYSSSEIYVYQNGIIDQMVIQDNLCYFNSVSVNNTDMTSNFNSEISCLNLDDNSINTIKMNDPISSFNIFENNFYYVANSKVYLAQLSGQDSKEIGSALSSHTTSDLYSIEVFSINNSLSDVYIATGLSYQSFQPIGNSEKFAKIIKNEDQYSLSELEFHEGDVAIKNE